MEQWLFLLGRILLGGFFLMSGMNHFSQLGPMTGYAQSKGLPAPKLAVLGTGLLLLVGGASILLGFSPQIGVAALVLFFLPTNFIMHAFWKVSDPQARMVDMLQFMKNTALTGASLILLAIPQPWSLSLGW
jgi:uncharacterized membrane protein YphA (DoxX/SURF4 family)